MCSLWGINRWGWCLGSDTKKLKSHLSGGARLLQPLGLRFQDQDRCLHLGCSISQVRALGRLRKAHKVIWDVITCASLSFRWWIWHLVAEGPESRSDVEAFVLQLFLWLSSQTAACCEVIPSQRRI